MRKALMLILLMNFLISHAQTESAIFAINSNSIISINNTMIDPLDSDHNINSLSYTPKNPVQLLVGNSTATIKTCVLENDEDEEKYGFNAISIYKNGNKVFDLKQSETWAYTYDGACTYNYRKYTNNRYFIPVKLSNNSIALLFVGWPYGGDLPYLTIIVMTEKDTKLVFNKNMRLDSITNTENQCIMKVQTGLEEYNSSGKLCVAPIFAQIYLKNGVLYLKR